MKKIVSLILCFILVCGVGTYFAQADTNYCKLFEDNINILRWGMNGNADVAEGASFPLSTIFDNLEMKLANDYYKEGEDFVNIPADVFEEKAKKCFAVIDVDAIRAYEEDFYNQETDSTDKRKIYDEAQNVYVFPAAGGFGDPSRYVVKGYVENGGKYTVYSYFIDPSEADETLIGDEGKDYFVYEGQKCKIDHTIKNVVETDGTDVKFHSWEKISTVPEVEGLITPPTQSDEKDPNDTTSKPNDSSSKPNDTTSKPDDSSSKPGESKPEDTTSSNPDESNVVTPPLESNPTVAVLAPQSVKLEAEVNAFPESTIVKVEEVKDGAKLATIKNALSGVSGKFVAYEITAQCKNVAVQPNGVVKATFNIPEDYKANRVVFYYISESGTREEVASYVNEENRTVVAEIPHFSTYVVAETNKPVDAAQAEIDKLNNAGKTEEGGSSLWIIIVIIVIALGVGGGIAAFFIIKRKKEETEPKTRPQPQPQRKPIKPQNNDSFGFVIVNPEDESENEESSNENTDSENENKGE